MTNTSGEATWVPGRVAAADVQRMMSRLLLTHGSDSAKKLSAFWVLIVLATAIAAAGVVADSTATVIGAMIVAPLMTPILGTALSVVLARRRDIVVNLAIILAGVLVVIAVSYLIGLTTPALLIADTNSQIAARVSPRLIDLLAALATGAVGAFAMVRSDISDALPGVAIAISLVPPLAVVGLTLESGAPDQAVGALLLFGTNVSAIITTGVIFFLAYRVRAAATDLGVAVGQLRPGTLLVVAGALVALAVPLGLGTSVVMQQVDIVSRATPVATAWAEAQNWQISTIEVRQGVLRIVALGQPPTISDADLRAMLDDAGFADVDVEVTLVFGGSRLLTADG